VENASDGRFVAPDRLVFVRDGALMASTFDLARLAVTGSPVALVAGVMHATGGSRPGQNSLAGQFDVSATGTLVFADGGIHPVRMGRLTWVGRDGTAEPLQAPVGYYARPTLSPDGRRLAVSYAPEKEPITDSAIAALDIDRGVLSRITEKGYGWAPLWSRDGSRIYFGGGAAVSAVAPDGASTPVEVLPSSAGHYVSAEAPDGSRMFLIGRITEGGTDILHAPPGGAISPWLATNANEAWAEISPDGVWMAYGSDASGQFEVYVQPYPGPGPRRQVSIGGGVAPLWSHSGMELFFYSATRPGSPPTRSLNVADFGEGNDPVIGKPRVLFTGPYLSLGGVTSYDISPDDQRFLMIESVEAPDLRTTRLHLVLDWTAEMRRLTGG
jgi:hypothetical protein